MAHVCLHSESGYTLGFRRRIAHSSLHGETGGVSDGGGITTLGAFRTFTNIPGPGVRTANFAAFGSWTGAFPENTESLRDSDALMRVAVSRRRGPAGLRDPVAIVSMIKNMINPWANTVKIRKSDSKKSSTVYFIKSRQWSF